MSEKVLPFPQRDHNRSLGLSEVEQQRQRIGLIRRVKQAANADEVFRRPDDVIWPARTVDRCIAECKQIKKTAGDIHAILAAEGRSVSHLERLRVNHKKVASHSRITNEHSDLRKRVRPYVHVLEAMAKVLGRDSEQVLCEAFRDTSYNIPSDQRISDPIDDLHFMITSLTQSIVRAQSLGDYFKMCEDVLGQYDLMAREFISSRTPVLSSGCEGDATYFWLFAYPFPCLPLLRLERANFSGHLRIEDKLIAPPSFGVNDVARLVSPLRNPEHGHAVEEFGSYTEANAELRLSSDICLVIGPRDGGSDIGPMFQTRSFVELRVGDSDCELTGPFSMAPLYLPIQGVRSELEFLVGTVAARFEGGWRRVCGINSQRWSGTVSLTHFGRHFDDGPSFEPVIDEWGGRESGIFLSSFNLSTLSQVLKRVSLADPRWAEDKWRVLFETDGPHPKPTEFSSPEPLMIALETALHTGAIEASLNSECQHLKAELAKRVASAKHTRDQEAAALLARWQRMGEFRPAT